MDTNTPYSFQSPTRPGAPVNKFKNKKLGCGCASIPLLLIFAVMFFFAYHLFFPDLFPKSMRGDLQNVLLFPAKDGKNLLWIQTDGSFSYIQQTKSGGSFSIGRKGFFEKTFSYVYDPVSKDVLNGFKTDCEFLPGNPEMLFVNGKIWVVTPSATSPAEINVYNPENYQEEINTKSFCAKTPELAAGLEKLYVERGLPVRLNLTSKDGKEVIYCMQEEKFFADYSEMQKYFAENQSMEGNMFTLENEKNSGARKVLYYISGPSYQLYFSSPRGEDIAKGNNVTNDKLKAIPILHSKVFIESELLYFDDEIAVVIHQDNVGKNADRMLTCVDKTGKELWTIPQEQLFDEIKVKEKDAFSIIFFMKSKFAVQRSGNTVVFIYKPEGAIGFDLASGKKLWEFDD